MGSHHGYFNDVKVSIENITLSGLYWLLWVFLLAQLDLHVHALCTPRVHWIQRSFIWSQSSLGLLCIRLC